MKKMLFTLVASLSFYGLMAQKTIFVNSSQTGIADGTSWETAYRDLSSALLQAENGDQIWMSEGTYTPGDSQNSSYQINSSVSIIGGFQGTETDPEERDTSNYSTLQGEITVSDTLSSVFHIITTERGISKVTLDGLLLQNAYAVYPDSGLGGAINSKADSLFINNCRFINNRAEKDGGAIYCDSTEYIKVTKSYFSGNHAARTADIAFVKSHGFIEVYDSEFANTSNTRGLILSDSSGIRVRGCHFHNHTENGRGCIVNYSPDSSNIIKDCIYENNSGYYASLAYLGGPTVVDNIIMRNNVTNINGIYFWNDHDITINNVLYEDNESSQAGAFYFSGSKSATITNSTFRNSTGNSQALAFYFSGSKLALDNVAFDNISEGSQASCFYASGDTISIMNSTFKDIKASSSGCFYAYFDQGTIDSSYFENCQANSQAGTFYISSGNWKITNTDFHKNQCLQNQIGTFYASCQRLEVNNCNFTENWSNNQFGTFGAWGDTLIVRNCHFEDNYAKTNGGAFGLFPDQEALIDSCTFLNNGSDYYFSYGGAVYGSGQPEKFLIKDCIFKGNTASRGGALYAGASMTVFRCEFTGNHADTSLSTGGAIINYGQQFNCIGNVFENNSSGTGGAISMDVSRTNPENFFANNTIINNVSTKGQGGAFYSGENTTLSLTNNLIWDNGDSSIYFEKNAGSVNSQQNISDDGQWLPAASYEAELMDNYKPSRYSAMVDYGILPDFPVEYDSDLFGNERVQGNAIDAGAVESPYLQEFITLSGKIIYDKNQNCEKDEEDKGINRVKVTAEPGGFYTQSGTSGKYIFKLKPGTYSLSQDLDENEDIIMPICPAGNSYNDIVLSSTGIDTSGFDFYNDMRSCEKLDVSLTAERKRNCFSSSNQILVRNLSGVSSEAAVLKFTFPKAVTIQTTSISSDSATENSLYFTVPALASLEDYTITIRDSVNCDPTAANIGTTIAYKAELPDEGTCSSTSPSWNGAEVAIHASCGSEITRFTIENSGNAEMLTASDVQLLRNDTVIYQTTALLDAGQRKVLEMEKMGGLFRVEATQVPDHPDPENAYATIENCDTLAVNGSFNPNDSRFGYDEEVVSITGSYDPNAIEVSPQGWGPEGYVVPEEAIFTYTIHFQNTGNDTAFTVKLIDSLPEGLDITSLELLDASHDYEFVQLGENSKILKWTFSDILLVDSATNASGSMGYIKFRIKAEDGLVYGTELENKADIYFDYNLPIETNTVLNTYVENYPENIGSIVVSEDVITSTRKSSNKHLAVYPNPTSAILHLPEDASEVEIMNAQGIMIYATKAPLNPVNTSAWAPGVYFVKVKAGGVKETVKVLKK